MRLLYALCLCLVTQNCMCQQQLHYTVYFGFDKDTLNGASKQQLAVIGAKLHALPITAITIGGHADKKGSDAYNRILSAHRANAILQSLSGYLPANVTASTAGFGKDSLITLADKEQQKNRRAEIYIVYQEEVKEAEGAAKPTEESLTRLEPFFEDVEKQQFAINLDDTVVVGGKQGTRLKIAPGTLQTKTGAVAKGMAVLEMQEYYSPGDIVQAGLNSVSDRGLLQTGGMVHFRVMQKQDTLATATRKTVGVRMPIRNKELTGMQVFAKHTNADSAVWNNTSNFFTAIYGYWDWPTNTSKIEGVGEDVKKYGFWQPGQKETEAYRLKKMAFWRLWPDASVTGYYVKRVARTVTRVDSATLKVQASITYRNRGYRAFKARHFDTTFAVRYHLSAYDGVLNNSNWINCDRFLATPVTTRFFVSIPHFSGAYVLVYFKKLNAFLPVGAQTGIYQVNNVPPAEGICIVALGKQGDNYYFGKANHTITGRETVAVELEKMGKDDIKKQLKEL